MKKNLNLNERMYPDIHTSRVRKDHLSRYEFVVPYVMGKIVADIACGEGYGSAMMSASGAGEVIGLDNNEETIAKARKKYNGVDFRVADATNTGLPDASVDVVTCFEAWHHLDQYQKFIPEMKRILKPGGLFICSVPNKHVIYLNPFHKKMFTAFYRADFDKQTILDFMEDDFEVVGWYGQRFVKPILTNPTVRLCLYIISSLGFLRDRVNNAYKLANGPAVLPLGEKISRSIVVVARSVV